MKKIVIGIAAAGLISGLNAADLGAQDAAFLFGQEPTSVVAISDTEMVQTEGQVLEILNPLLALTDTLSLGSLLPMNLLSLDSLALGDMGNMSGGLSTGMLGVVALTDVLGALPMMGSMALNAILVDTLNGALPVNFSHVDLSKGLPVELLDLKALPMVGMLSMMLPINL